MIRESQIQQKLAASLKRAGGVWDFAEWFDAASWGMHKDSSPGAIAMASAIQHLFAHYDNGLLGEASLVEKLRVAAAPSVVVIRAYSNIPHSAAVKVSAAPGVWDFGHPALIRI